MRARGEETRHAVLRAAERVFAERGYAGARMDDVASAVGIRRASLVYYYRDKRHLYRALTEDLFGGLLQRYRAVLAGPGPDRDRLTGCLDVWSEQVAQRPGLLRVLMWELARVPPVNAEIVRDVAPIFEELSNLIRAGQRDGTFRPIDPLRFIMMIGGATAFLTLGMGTLVASGVPMGAEDLKVQLRAMADRMLFMD